MPINAAAALGQEVGKILETTIVDHLRSHVEPLGFAIGPERLKNGTNNIYQIDAIIRNEAGDPVVLIDPKYIRYKKHNRDKGSWLCTAHYNLHKSYPSIRKTLAVLAGNWSAPSMDLIRSFGIEIHQIPFLHLVNALMEYEIVFEWDERDRTIPRESLEKFQILADSQKTALGRRMIHSIIDTITNSVMETINTNDQQRHSKISRVEVTLRTTNNELLFKEYANVSATLAGLTEFVSDIDNVEGHLKDPN